MEWQLIAILPLEVYIRYALTQLGVVACSCNPAIWRLDVMDGLRAGVLMHSTPCRLGILTKINMGALGSQVG
jgi:hypothetical protein